MNIKFNKLTEEHLELLYEWFNLPSVNKWYARSKDWSLEDIRNKYFPRIEGKEIVPSFIIYGNNDPIGYIQYYSLTNSLPDGVSDYNHRLFTEYDSSSLVGLDLFIIDKFQKNNLCKLIIDNFICSIIPNHIKAILIDPLSENIAAVKAFTNSGFTLYDKLIDQQRSKEIYLMIKKL